MVIEQMGLLLIVFIIFIITGYLSKAQFDLTKNVAIEKGLLNEQVDSFYQCQQEAVLLRLLIFTYHQLLPNIPQKVVSKQNISFLLFTRQTPVTPEELSVLENEYPVKISKFNPRKPTVIFADGFNVSSRRSIQLLPSRILPSLDCNLIIVNWDSYNTFNIQYTRNITVPRVGNITASFIRQLLFLGANAKEIYLIGFSAGSQIVSLAAKRIPNKIGKMLVIDPQGSCFNYLSETERVAASDAEHVTVVHSSVGLRSMPLNIHGTATFYVNGGYYQDRCLGLINEHLTFTTCNHALSADYFFDGLFNFRMSIGVKCNSYQDYLKKQCNCNDTAVYGFYTPASVKELYFVDTIPFQSTTNNPSCIKYPFSLQ